MVKIEDESELNEPKGSLTECCCGCSLRQGVMIIAVLSIIGGSLNLGLTFLALQLLEDVGEVVDSVSLDIAITTTAFLIFGALCGLLGTKWYSPHLVIIFAVGEAVSVGGSIGTLIVGDNDAFGSVWVYIPGLLLQIYFIFLILAFWKQVQDTIENPEHPRLKAAGIQGGADSSDEASAPQIQVIPTQQQHSTLASASATTTSSSIDARNTSDGA